MCQLQKNKTSKDGIDFSEPLVEMGNSLTDQGPVWWRPQVGWRSQQHNRPRRTSQASPPLVWSSSCRSAASESEPRQVVCTCLKNKPTPLSRPGRPLQGLCSQPIKLRVHQPTCKCFYWRLPHYFLVIRDVHQMEKSHCHHIALILEKHVIQTLSVGLSPIDIWRLLWCLRKWWTDSPQFRAYSQSQHQQSHYKWLQRVLCKTENIKSSHTTFLQQLILWT